MNASPAIADIAPLESLAVAHFSGAWNNHPEAKRWWRSVTREHDHIAGRHQQLMKTLDRFEAVLQRLETAQSALTQTALPLGQRTLQKISAGLKYPNRDLGIYMAVNYCSPSEAEERGEKFKSDPTTYAGFRVAAAESLLSGVRGLTVANGIGLTLDEGASREERARVADALSLISKALRFYDLEKRLGNICDYFSSEEKVASMAERDGLEVSGKTRTVLNKFWARHRCSRTTVAVLFYYELSENDLFRISKLRDSIDTLRTISGSSARRTSESLIARKTQELIDVPVPVMRTPVGSAPNRTVKSAEAPAVVSMERPDEPVRIQTSTQTIPAPEPEPARPHSVKNKLGYGAAEYATMCETLKEEGIPASRALHTARRMLETLSFDGIFRNFLEFRGVMRQMFNLPQENIQHIYADPGVWLEFASPTFVHSLNLMSQAVFTAEDLRARKLLPADLDPLSHPEKYFQRFNVTRTLGLLGEYFRPAEQETPVPNRSEVAPQLPPGSEPGIEAFDRFASSQGLSVSQRRVIRGVLERGFVRGREVYADRQMIPLEWVTANARAWRDPDGAAPLHSVGRNEVERALRTLVQEKAVLRWNDIYSLNANISQVKDDDLRAVLAHLWQTIRR